MRYDALRMMVQEGLVSTRLVPDVPAGVQEWLERSLTAGHVTARVSCTMAHRGDAESARQLVTHDHACARWAACGRPVFDLTHGLAAGLLLTRATDVVDEFVHMPFPTLVVRVPMGVVPMWDSDHQDAEHWVNLVVVHRYEGGAGPMVYIETWCADMRVDLYQFIDAAAHPAKQDANLPVFDEGALIQTPSSLDERTSLTVHHLVRNLLRYLVGRTLGTPDNERHGRRGEPREDATRTWILGRDVKLPRELRQHVTDGVREGTRSEVPGWRVRTRHVVCGHWRNQACGEKYAEHKTIWIEPHWRGPVGSEAFLHLHKTKEG